MDLQFSSKLVYLRIDSAGFRLDRASVSSYWVAIRKGISLGVFCRSLNSRYTIDLYASCYLVRSGCYEPYKVGTYLRHWSRYKLNMPNSAQDIPKYLLSLSLAKMIYFIKIRDKDSRM